MPGASRNLYRRQIEPAEATQEVEYRSGPRNVSAEGNGQQQCEQKSKGDHYLGGSGAAHQQIGSSGLTYRAPAVSLAVITAKFGGDGWESNPPRTPQQRPADGFEDRGEHQLPYIPDDRARLTAGLDGYSLGNWSLAFSETASAAAALTDRLA
jgi:hypothetical protein